MIPLYAARWALVSLTVRAGGGSREPGSERLAKFMPPNEDFGRQNKRSVVSFRSTFQGSEYSIWATTR